MVVTYITTKMLTDGHNFHSLLCAARRMVKCFSPRIFSFVAACMVHPHILLTDSVIVGLLTQVSLLD